MICFLDLETTGLDPKKGSILEIAAVLTDDDLQPLGEPFSQVVRPTHLRGYEAMDDYVRNMHAKSGLLERIYLTLPGTDEVPVAPEYLESARRLGEAEIEITDWLFATVKKYAPAILLTEAKTIKAIPLSGNSIHFDRGWLVEHMPTFERLFLHRNIDVSTFNEAARRWEEPVYTGRPGAGGEPAHRALDDVRNSIEVLAHYRRCLFDGLYSGAKSA